MPSRLKLRPRATPAIPETDTEVVFLDQADGVLKSIDDTGTVTNLGSAGGGAIAVTDGTTTVEDVSTLQTPSITDLGGGTVILGPISGSPAAVFYSDTDPGAVGPGGIWVRDDQGYGILPVFVRNTANDGWLPAGQAAYGADGANLTPTAYLAVESGGVAAYTQSIAEAQQANFVMEAASASLTWQSAGLLVTASGTLLGVIGSQRLIVTATQVVLPSLPTVNPSIAGAIWNDAGTLKVSAG